jgi:hypothetical protein
MAQGLTDHQWSVPEYTRDPVHVAPWQRAIWSEERENLLPSPQFAEER